MSKSDVVERFMRDGWNIGINGWCFLLQKQQESQKKDAKHWKKMNDSLDFYLFWWIRFIISFFFCSLFVWILFSLSVYAGVRQVRLGLIHHQFIFSVAMCRKWQNSSHLSLDIYSIFYYYYYFTINNFLRIFCLFWYKLDMYLLLNASIWSLLQSYVEVIMEKITIVFLLACNVQSTMFKLITVI